MTKRRNVHRRIHLVLARSVGARMKGLLGRIRPPGPHTGLWIVPCWTIHTIGMKFPIDVAFMDSEGKLRRLVRNLRPGRVAFCFGAASVVEMAVNADDSTLRYRRRLHVALRRFPK